MPTLETDRGEVIEATPPGADAINANFTAAMNADPGADRKAPPKRDQAAAATGSAPADAKPRRGRPKGEAKARTEAKVAEAIKDDYTPDAASAVGDLWLMAAVIPFTQPYALVIEANSDPLVAALAEGAKHNATIRRLVGSGGNTWAVSLAGVALTMGVQALQIARDPAVRAEATAATRESLKAVLKAKGFDVGDQDQAAPAAA